MPQRPLPCISLLVAFAAGCFGTYDALPVLLCGNGQIDDGEQCDDGNDVEADGCELDCTYSGAVMWSQSYDEGKGASEYLSHVAVDSTGHIYAAGYPYDRDDYKWLQRYSPSGELLWTYELPLDSTFTGVRGLAVDSADRAVVVGFRDSDVLRYPFAINVTPSGAPGWTLMPQDQETAGIRLNGIAAHASKLYAPSIVWGGEDGTVELLQVVVLSEDGSVENTFIHDIKAPDGTVTIDIPDSIAVASDGTIVVAGSHRPAPLRNIAFATAFDPDGAVRWEQQHSTPYGAAWFNEVAIDSKGDVVVAGLAHDGLLHAGAESNAELQNNNILVLKYDAAGTLQWKFSLDGGIAENDWADGLTIDSQDHIIVAGVLRVPNYLGETWVRKLDGHGTPLWTRTLELFSWDGAMAVTHDASDHIIVAGYYYHSTDEKTNGMLVKFTP